MRRSALAVLLLALPAAAADPVALGKHNLSVSGPGAVKAQSEPRTCVFCHVAHGAREGGDNRPASAVQPLRYQSSTMASRLAAPAVGGASRACLSCHDGTIALGQTVKGARIAMRGAAPGDRMPEGKDRLGFDLSGTHPVSVGVPADGRFRLPAPGDAVKLDRKGQVQCTSCHDPHSEGNDPEARMFLVKPNRGGAICLSCHALPLWRTNPAAHQASFASPVPPGTAAPGEYTYATIADNACATCHPAHEAYGPSLTRGARGQGDDRLCLGCHDGRVASTDVASQVARPYAHAAPPAGPSGHDASEGPASPLHRLPEDRPSTPRHVTCVDCHDPHAAVSRTSFAPRAAGSLAGVWGIDRNGMRVDPVNFEYEVCFKCHADSANQPQARPSASMLEPRRQLPDANLRRVFDPGSAASFHPVVATGRSAAVPGLLRPWIASSMVYCSDCHASDAAPGGRAPRGPHGSAYPHILERPYLTADRTAESPQAYALCYKCHDRNLFALAPASLPAGTESSRFPSHYSHVVTYAAPCSACHDAHGVSSLSGNRVNNAHLVDFDVNVVSPNRMGIRQYVSSGTGGNCSLSCHGADHDGRAYP